MSFQIMAYVTTIAACLLGLRFIVAGAGVLREWGVEVTSAGLILTRRLGVLYLGLGLVFFIGRDAPPSDFRSAVCLVMAAVIAALAGLGLFEFLARRATTGILRSAIAEAVLAVAFVVVWWLG